MISTLIKRFLKAFNKYFSYVVLIVCMLMFMIAFFSNIASKAPILDYFVREMELPNVCLIEGRVCIRQSEQDVSIPVTITVGGYKTEQFSGEKYQLRFTAVQKEDIPVIITYSFKKRFYQKIEYINMDSCTHLERNFLYIIGD